MERYFSTAQGRHRLLNELQKAIVAENRALMERNTIIANLGLDRMPGCDLSEHMNGINAQLDECIRTKMRIEQIRAECRPDVAPEPKNTDTVQIDLEVTLRYPAKKGEKASTCMMRIGGHGECDPSAKPPIWSYTAALCRKLMRKEVGDIITHDGQEIEIIDIQFPPSKAATKAA